nr:hypothetical protein [Paenibacillus faecis]
MKSITHFVEEKLKLKVNRTGRGSGNPSDLALSNKQVTIRLAPMIFSRFKEKVRELTSRTRSISMKERISR